jgi:hypothetical protein
VTVIAVPYAGLVAGKGGSLAMTTMTVLDFDIANVGRSQPKAIRLIPAPDRRRRPRIGMGRRAADVRFQLRRALANHPGVVDLLMLGMSSVLLFLALALSLELL